MACATRSIRRCRWANVRVIDLPSPFLAELAWTDVETFLAGGGHRAIIPLGATENHGPHSPLGTDTIIATGVCRRLGPALDALVAPVLPFGHSPHHSSFPGTISFPNRLVADIVGGTAFELARHGFTTLVFYSGHGGNKVALDLAVSEILDRRPELVCVHAHQLAVQTAQPFRAAVEEKYGRPLSRLWGAHGGEQETAAVLAERPELVRLERAPAEPDVDLYLRRTRDPAVVRSDRNLRTHAPYGTWGDPRGATAEQGELFLDAVAAELAERILASLYDTNSH